MEIPLRVAHLGRRTDKEGTHYFAVLEPHQPTLDDGRRLAGALTIEATRPLAYAIDDVIVFTSSDSS